MNEEWIIENHPWNFYIPDNAETLIIGTFPTAKSNWSFDFFYPNKRNILWRILAEIAEHQLAFMEHDDAVKERKGILDFLKVGITDMGQTVKRFSNSSLDEKLQLINPMDIFKLIEQYPSIKKIILTSSSGKVSALSWFSSYLVKNGIAITIPKGKKPITFVLNRNNIGLPIHILYSPSPRASNRISFQALVSMYKDVIL